MLRRPTLAVVGGVNIHAGPPVDGRDRRRLERLCRYVARPPLAQDRLKVTADGRVRLEFKRAWSNGTYGVLLDPLDFIGRLAALVPPPKFHLLRYHGVFAANAKARAKVVPGPRSPNQPTQLCLAFDGEALEPESRARNSRHLHI